MVYPHPCIYPGFEGGLCAPVRLRIHAQMMPGQPPEIQTHSNLTPKGLQKYVVLFRRKQKRYPATKLGMDKTLTEAATNTKGVVLSGLHPGYWENGCTGGSAPDTPHAKEALPKEMDSLVVRNSSLIDMFAKSVHVDWS